MSSLTMSKRTMAIGMIAAFAMAIIISMTMTSPAMAAQKKPYAGYQYEDSYTTYDPADVDHKNPQEVKYTATSNAGSITLNNSFDTRKVKKGCEDLTIWSGDYFMASLEQWTDNEADRYTMVANTSQFNKYKEVKALRGIKYNKKKNTLTLKNVKAPAYVLNISGMGSGFKIVLKGKNQLAGLNINAIGTYIPVQKQTTDDEGKPVVETDKQQNGYYICNVKIDGTGKLDINKKKYINDAPVTIDGGGTWDIWNEATKKYDYFYKYTKSKLTITGKPSVRMYAYGTNNLISVEQSGAKKPVSIKGVKKGVLDAALQKNPSRSFYRLAPDFYGFVADPAGTYTDASGNKYKMDEDVYYVDDATLLNDGAYYGVPDLKNGARYLDTKLRKTCYTAWRIYKPTILTDSEGYPETEAAVFVNVVGNNKDLPAGYTATISYNTGTNYSYVVKNSKLVAGK